MCTGAADPTCGATICHTECCYTVQPKNNKYVLSALFYMAADNRKLGPHLPTSEAAASHLFALPTTDKTPAHAMWSFAELRQTSGANLACKATGSSQRHCGENNVKCKWHTLKTEPTIADFAAGVPKKKHTRKEAKQRCDLRMVYFGGEAVVALNVVGHGLASTPGATITSPKQLAFAQTRADGGPLLVEFITV